MITRFAVFALAWASMTTVFGEAPKPPAEEVMIRHLDRIVRDDGRIVDCLILTPNPQVGQQLRVRIRTVTTDLAAGVVQEIIPRRSAQQSYDNWVKWLRRAQRTGGTVSAGRSRAEAELALANWCGMPHPDLEGEPPMPAAALRHRIKAATADATLPDVWPHVIAGLRSRASVDDVSDDQLEEEVTLYLSAIAADYRSSDLDHRLGLLLVKRLRLSERAIPYLERVLRASNEGGSPNAGQRREARSTLAKIFGSLGRDGDALGLYAEDLAGDLTGPDKFVALWESTDILVRIGTPESLTLARERLAFASVLQPGFVEIELKLASLDYAAGEYKEASKRLRNYLSNSPDDVAAKVDLALVDIALGKLNRAGKSLSAILSGGADGEAAVRAHLGLGSIAELRGNTDVAASAYTQALARDENHVVASLLAASARIRQGQGDAAREILKKLLVTHSESRAVFGACSRLLALVDAASGDGAKAAARLEFAADTRPNDPSVLEMTGLALLRENKLNRGFGYLVRANEMEPGRAATLSGLGYYHYEQGARVQSAKLFDESLAALKKSPPRGADAAEKRRTKAYASSARALIKDLEILQVWIDEFDGEDDGPIDGWEEIEIFGIDVSSQKSQVVMKGRQQKNPDGETGIRLLRNYRSSDVERVSVRVRIDRGVVTPFLRLGGPQGSRTSLAALEVFRDLGGMVKFRARNSRGEWTEAEVPATDGAEGVTPVSRDELIYTGGVPWPADQQFHTFEIRRAQGKKSFSKRGVFDVFFDGEVVARNVSVAGLSTQYELGVFARTDALENEYSITVDDFKVFRINRRAKRSK
jgi:tetratricopeptide (TPR) repeat protein